ncbi:DUF1769-domain-containing protein [Microthyrium microscopicum]|uniref:DUF1769-domain-containing protein n=1 Tax=Microthyrium microscopicum TaxID=703497 RepID=A0A6A6UIU0_9PEZI|nr:DUF1769-domain-containing protein [Microthyrium microscopicum]
MSTEEKYMLRVTAGAQYSEQQPFPVNKATPLKLSSESADIYLTLRIKDFRPPPDSDIPKTCAYFDVRKGARYSIGFTLVPKKDLGGDDITLGNDFDKPIREYLPPLFGTALNIVKTMIDPGLDGDPYSDKPYLNGPLLSSVNIMRIGPEVEGEVEVDGAEVLKEGASGKPDEEPSQKRAELGLPSAEGKRAKGFLKEDKRKKWTFEKGRRYDFDFFNGYLDFNDFALKLPMGLSFNLLRILGDKEEIPPLRYVLRDRKTDQLLFHATFQLVRKGSKEDKESKPGAVENNTEDSKPVKANEDKAVKSEEDTKEHKPEEAEGDKAKATEDVKAAADNDDKIGKTATPKPDDVD